MVSRAQVQLPPKLVPVFLGEARYRGAHGGRGSGKSFSFAKMLAVRGYAKKIRVLCCREFQNSIKDSVHSEIVNAIQSEPWLENAYDYGESFIRGKNGTEFIFKGLKHNYREIKSISGINLAWVEEAEAVSEQSWRTLTPTIREPGSEIWLTWNPESLDSPTQKRFIDAPPPRAKIAEINYLDNPWFTQELEEERQNDLRRDPDMYRHIWEGECITRTDAQILGGKYSIREFEPRADWDGPYYGMDFGFANDPTTAGKSWINGEKLYVEYDAGSVGLELDDTADFFISRVPGIEKNIIRADSARPESISYLRRHGLPLIKSAAKGPGSIEDGVAFLKSFTEIVIHPRCIGTAIEARLYSYKIDRLSGDVLPVIVDANNHYIDCLRYSLEPVMRNIGNINIRQL